MKIIYVSSVMSRKKNTEIMNSAKKKPLQSIQKYNRLLCEGLVESGADVKTISAIPMSKDISDKKIWICKKEQEKGVTFSYLPFINMKIFRQLSLFFSIVIFLIKEIYSREKPDYVICDILNTTISSVSLVLCKLTGTKVIGLVTDLPSEIGEGSVSNKLNQYFENKYDGYILLTKQMNEVLNSKNRPWLVIEGICEKHPKFNGKKKDNICVYTGGLYEKYGIKMLIDAFVELNGNLELHLYGDGDLVEYINKLNNDRIKYYGVIENDQIVRIQQEANLLINPRPSVDQYTMYSFPSKNMEYMASGTPVLTTNLPGIPNEYNQYTYILQDESEKGILGKLKQIFSTPINELVDFGNRAQEFVTKEKDKSTQGKKLKKFLEEKFYKEEEKKISRNLYVIYQSYLVILLFSFILFSRNTLYTSLYFGFTKTFIILFALSIPMVLGFLYRLYNKQIDYRYLFIIILLLTSMTVSILFKVDLALYNITNLISIALAYIYSQEVNFKWFKLSFILIILFLSISSLINLNIIRPNLEADFEITNQILNNSLIYKLNSSGTPFVNMFTSFVVWVPGYTRNFSVFTEPSFFQFYIIIATMLLYYSKYRIAIKWGGIILFTYTMITTMSASGLIILSIMVGLFIIDSLVKMKSTYGRIVLISLLIFSAMILIRSPLFKTLSDALIYKLFSANDSIDARTGSITMAIDAFFSSPIIGTRITPFLESMDVTNTLISIFGIYGLISGCIAVFITWLFSQSLSRNYIHKFILFLCIILSTSSHIFLGVQSFWLIFFTIALRRTNTYESTLDCK